MASKKTAPKTTKKEQNKNSVIVRKTFAKESLDMSEGGVVFSKKKDKPIKNEVVKPKKTIKEKTTKAIVKEIKKKKEKKALGKKIEKIIEENTTSENNIKGILNEESENVSEIIINEPILNESEDINIKEIFNKITETKNDSEISENTIILTETDKINNNIENNLQEVPEATETTEEKIISKEEASKHQSNMREQINSYGQMMCDVIYGHWTIAMRGSVPFAVISEAIALADKSFNYETIVSDGTVSIKISKGGYSETFPKEGALIIHLE